ncbi:URC4/urg3 family protein [Legionella oakridgensis]|uniref:URC4/urg3 family protein n=1 Tax=Legionella oakridgensis TaxID=29423 RepID=UPI0003DE307B|nr:URC4/urg3 family protein [Legionella oakridgensis]ETO94484.1 hypothetical protein LOR_53c11240 [Legionella oakridgensis RV-2-2007]
MNNHDDSAAKVLQSLQALPTIRKQAQRLFNLACQDKLKYFAVDMQQLTATASFVLDVIYDQYPKLDIPYHSRWRHFEAGGVDRIKALQLKLASFSPEERGKIFYELVIISVLLDAGAGKHWHYIEPDTGLKLSRSEGLAVASLALYLKGAFSAHPEQPWRVDSKRLLAFSEVDLRHGFQVDADNLLEGVAGRVKLLNRLGAILAKETDYFGHEGRLGDFYTYIASLQFKQTIATHQLFQSVLAGFGNVWPERLRFHGVALGDVWCHPSLKTDAPGSEFIPFHKLSQWLTYSLMEPLEQSAIQVIGLDDLTGLPEYRNGGLLLDLGLLRLKNKENYQQPQDPGSELIVEWRGLTVALLDEIAKVIRRQLGRTSSDLPLAKILQGGTWEAGRRIAKQKRIEGTPPIQIISDGTIF